MIKSVYTYQYLRIWWVCLFLVFTKVLVAQDLIVKRLNIGEGLSNSTVECIFQDNRGFMWFGTRDGLNKYDGYSITSYKHDPRNPQSISDSYITSIFQDSEGNFWVGTKSGLNLFDQKRGVFLKIKLSTTFNAPISKLAELEKGNLLVATKGAGLFLLTLKEANLKKQTIVKLAQQKYFTDIYVQSAGRVWLTTSSGLFKMWRKPGGFGAKKVLSQDNINVIASNKNTLWLGTEDEGIICYNWAKGQSKVFKHDFSSKTSIGSNQIKTLMVDDAQNLWIGSINGGLDKIDLKNLALRNYTSNPNSSAGLSQRTISALFEDSQGNIWIGTHRGGVNIYSPASQKFPLQRQTAFNKGLSYNDIKSFYEDKNGEIWIGTDGGGIDVWSADKTRFTYLKSNPFNQKSLGSNEVLDITADAKGDIYVSTWGGGLNKFDRSTGNFVRYVNSKNLPNSISGNFVQKAYEDSRGNFWVCLYYNGLNLFDKTTGTFSRFKDGAKGSQLRGNNVVTIFEDKSANLWIGTDDGGLNKYNLDTRQFSHYFTREEKSPDIRVVFEDQKGRIWVGQRGLYLYDKAKDNFSPFCADCPLAQDFIKGILEDNEGNLWISTTNGIVKLNPDKRTWRKYNMADGLQSLEFEANAYMKTRAGEMFFGGVNGFNHFFPSRIHFNRFVPPLYLTNFQIFNETILPSSKKSPLKQDISFTKKIDLNYKQSTFSFSFSALNYISTQNNRYEYILEGFEKNWTATSETRRAYYTNVPPGYYTFKVRAANNDGVWNNGIALPINISPPFWAMWWFRLVVVSTAIYVVFLILRFRRSLELKAIEERKKEEIHQIQLQFFTNISHELRTPLALIMGPAERLLKENSASRFAQLYHTIYNNSNRLLNLINELMDFRKLESGNIKLKVQELAVNPFFADIEDEFSELAFEKNLSFTLVNNSKRGTIWVDKNVLEKICLNLLINAVKYTQNGGHVKLELADELALANPKLVNQLRIQNNSGSQNFFYIKIADNGIGISAQSITHLFERYYRVSDAHLGSGIGLAFVKSLVSLHKGNIFINSERQEGTEIIVALPCTKDEFSNTEIIDRSDAEINEAEFAGQHTIEHADDEFKEHEPQPNHIKKILLVDDNKELRDFIKSSLKDSYTIIEAEDGLQGFELCKTDYPDLVISDVMMPNVNGIRFCKQLKEDVEISHIPFMILTAKASLEAELEAKSSGAEFYFSKPVNIALLKLTLHNIFEQQNKLKERYQKNYQVQAKELVTNVRDKEFLDKLLQIIESNISNTSVDIEFLCSEIGMSRTKLYQKVKDITGQAIGDFVRTVRLRKALKIMIEEDVALNEVMFRVGIQTQSYFTKAFKKEFNKTPGQFLQELKQKSATAKHSP
ncbi:two-component regulator propeller domain-containing protein [Pelobium manganitolerans]|uniref:two-component regulator propeller domain-containing protein n=1 Tax=Pelobium manganitolerans TaxID=1842495 RepID=UPI000E7319B3|nr:two-component regulator propeller domain-containing protein [Pelobium manganitolerans]